MREKSENESCELGTFVTYVRENENKDPRFEILPQE
jgi:hypothetical protein